MTSAQLVGSLDILVAVGKQAIGEAAIANQTALINERTDFVRFLSSSIVGESRNSNYERIYDPTV